MIKKILFPALALILAACLPPSGDAPTPSLTPDTSHLTPATPTLIPTSTPHPDFLALQEQIAAGGETFTLTQDGQIEMWTREEGARIVPGIQVYPDGTMTFTHEGQEYEVDTETLEIQDQTITFEDTKGRTWVFDGEKLFLTFDWESIPVDIEHRLSPTELEQLGMEGDGFALNTSYKNVPVRIAVVADPSVLEMTDGIGPALNKNLPVTTGGDSMERLSHAVLYGH